MMTNRITPMHTVLRTVGSLWFAAILLVMLLVAMAFATVFESMHNAERALVVFYRSSWFELLLALLVVNVGAAMLLRYPFSKRQIGFVITHSAIIITLLGSLVTAKFGVDGQLGITEGQTMNSFALRDVDVLTMRDRQTGMESSIELSSKAFKGFDAVVGPASGTLVLDDVSVKVMEYLPDSVATESMVNDNPRERHAVFVAFSEHDESVESWLHDSRHTKIGNLPVVFRHIPDGETWKRLAVPGSVNEGDTKEGLVKVTYAGETYEFNLLSSMEEAKPIGATGLALRVLRYLPHASVGPENKLVNISDKPTNPAIEAEIVGPDGTQGRIAFAKFPDFDSMHGDAEIKDLKLVFVAPESYASDSAIEILKGPAGEFVGRFTVPGSNAKIQQLALGDPSETPWPGLSVTVLKALDHARRTSTVEPKEPGKKSRVSAIKLEVSNHGQSNSVWLRKHYSWPLTVDDRTYDLAYTSKIVDLGFDVTLDQFTLGYYPGTKRPRSFESVITISDPAVGGKLNRVVSMNHPVSYGGFTLYQSSYRMDGGRSISYLSVARDPGQIVVFVGYIALMVGMSTVLTIRMLENRKKGLPGMLAGVPCEGKLLTPEQLLVNCSNGTAESNSTRSVKNKVSRPRKATPGMTHH